jgi:hypothetical protein
MFNGANLPKKTLSARHALIAQRNCTVLSGLVINCASVDDPGIYWVGEGITFVALGTALAHRSNPNLSYNDMQ